VHDFSYPLAHIVTARYWHKAGPTNLHLTVSETGWMKSIGGMLYVQCWWAPASCLDFDKIRAPRSSAMIQKYHVTTFCARRDLPFLHQGGHRAVRSSPRCARHHGREALHPEVFNRFSSSPGCG
jgi:acetyl-CoA synthetase